MKVVIDKVTQAPRYIVEKKDIADANAIRKMMDSRGWKVLKQYMEVGREVLIDNGKNGIKSRAKSELSKERWAILFGFDECLALADRIVRRAEEFTKQEYEEVKRGTADDEE